VSYTIAPAAQALLDQATARWPNRSRASDGTIGDQAHASRTSDHNPDSRGIVHAADLTHDPAHGCDNNINAEHIKNDPRVKYVIWNRRISNPAIAGGAWRPYTGTNPHDHHMHVSVTDAGENDTSPWFTTADTGGFGTMDDTAIRQEFANVTSRTGAQLDAVRKELHKQEQKHNERERARDQATEARLAALEAKLDRVLAKVGG